MEPLDTACLSVGGGAERLSLLGASSAMAGSGDIIVVWAVWGGEQETMSLSEHQTASALFESPEHASHSSRRR